MELLHLIPEFLSALHRQLLRVPKVEAQRAQLQRALDKKLRRALHGKVLARRAPLRNVGDVEL
jgi:hypothetical protein